MIPSYTRALLKVISFVTFIICVSFNTNAQITQKTHSVLSIGGAHSSTGNYQHFSNVGSPIVVSQGGPYTHSNAFMHVGQISNGDTTVIVDTTMIEFRVDMKAAINQNLFNPIADFVDIAGSFNNWSGGNEYILNDDDQDSIYTIKFEPIFRDSIQFKARINASWEPLSHEYAGTSVTRHAFIADKQHNVISFQYNDEDVYYPLTTFEINMEQAIFSGIFTPEDSTQTLSLKVLRPDGRVHHKYLLQHKEESIYKTTSQLRNVGEEYEFIVEVSTHIPDTTPTVVQEDIFRTYTVMDNSNLVSFYYNDIDFVGSLQLTVDMRWEAEHGDFDPSVDTVNFIGSNSSWSQDIMLTDDDDDLIYNVLIDSLLDSDLEFKIRLNSNWNRNELRSSYNRTLTLKRGINDVSIFYNRENIDHPRTTFEIDMSKVMVEDTVTGNVRLYLYENELAVQPLRGYSLELKEDFIYTGFSNVIGLNDSIIYKVAYNSVIDTIENEFTIYPVTGTSTTSRYFNNDKYYTGLRFVVNMLGMVANGRFDPGQDELDVVGTMTDWNGGMINLTDEDGDDIYEGEYRIGNHSEAEISFITRINGEWFSLSREFPGGERLRTVTPVKGQITTLEYHFDGENIDNKEVVFKVNMSHQETLGKFDTEAEGAGLRIEIYDGIHRYNYPMIVDDEGFYTYNTRKFEVDSLISFTVLHYTQKDGEDDVVVREDSIRSVIKENSQQIISMWFNDEIPEERFDAIWQINMQPAINSGEFDVANDRLTLKGSFDNWSEEIELVKNDTTNVYSTSVSLPESIIYYQLFVNGEAEAFVGQDESNNRSHHLSENNTVISVVYNFEEVEKVEEEDLQIEETEDGKAVIEIAEELFKELIGEIIYQVLLANGDALPDWVIFDPETLTFTIDPSKLPSGTRLENVIEDLDIIILANDEAGQSVAVEVTLPTEEIIADITDPEGPNALENDLISLINVYPSFVDQITTIDLDPTIQVAIVLITNVSGIQLETLTIRKSTQVDMSTYPSGLYLIQLKVEDQLIIKKVVKK
ncbi:T9SS type A sorting domain-containing protein [Flammeovirga sp. OC4]|uniref:T9SS type A sorting domain-containing protein n=1 Tax=Flammeovirga sp. OC4 TaxID=1382345 RepID=UPI0005C4A5EB|nr:T9SS type A sorting domain-containing protein [Flammeovirga sp. OC4]